MEASGAGGDKMFGPRGGRAGLELDEIDDVNPFTIGHIARNALKWPVKTN